MGREYELKFRSDPVQLEAVRSAYGDFTQIRMETVYYDSPAGAFGDRRWTLRCRRENALSVCTLKTSAPGGGRHEWEVTCTDIRSAIPLLIEAGAPEIIGRLAADGLEPVCGARFTRLAKRLSLPGGEIELALDCGVLIGGGCEEPFAEIEAELKQGDDAVVNDFGAELAEKYCLELEALSKFQRARQLAERRKS